MSPFRKIQLALVVLLLIVAILAAIVIILSVRGGP